MDRDPLADRVTSLEQSNRSLSRRLFIVTFAVSVLTCALIVEILFMPFAMVWNVASRQAILVSAFGDSAVMAFMNKRNERRLELGVVGPGSPVLNLLGRDQRPRIAMWVDEHDKPTVMLWDSKSEGDFKADLMPDGTPQVSMRAPHGKGTIYVGFLPDGNPVIRLRDKDGRIGFEVPVARD